MLKNMGESGKEKIFGWDNENRGLPQRFFGAEKTVYAGEVDRLPVKDNFVENREKKEVGFAEVKKEILRFLDTPFHQLLKEIAPESRQRKNLLYKMSDGDIVERPSNQIPSDPFVIMEALEQRFSLLASVPEEEKKTALEFLSALLLDDKMDGSNIPKAFVQTEEEAMQDAPKFWHDGFSSFYKPDVFSSCDEGGRYQLDNSDTENYNTYRSYYYRVILEALARFGKEGKKYILTCMKDVGSISTLPEIIDKNSKGYGKRFPKERNVKVGKDVSQQEFDQAWDWYGEYKNLLVENKKLSYSRTKEEFEKDVDYSLDADDFSTLQGDLVDNSRFGERYEDMTEFGHVYKKFYELLIGTDKVEEDEIKFLVDELSEIGVEKHSAYFYKILAIYNREPRSATKLLLEFINRQEENRLGKAFANRFLYHIELGKIGVDAGVLKYLDKKYNLQGEEKEKIKIAHRITGDGKVGLFGEDEILVGYIELGDLSGGEEQRQTQIMDLSRDLLFADPDTPDEIRQQFKKDYLKFFNDLFFKETGVYFNNLSLREQLWFFQFMKGKKGTEKKRLKDFVYKFGEQGIRAFISLEMDTEIGNKILYLAEVIPADKMKDVLSSYGRLVEFVEEESLRIAEATDNRDEQKNIVEGLSFRAKEIIAEVYQSISSGEVADNAVQQTLKNLRQESKSQLIVSGFFRHQTEVLQSGDNLDLRRFTAKQEAILVEINKSGGRALFLRALSARGELAPIPELFWKVDRNNSDYQKRFGFDTIELFKRLAVEGEKKVLVEFGQGSGKSKEERAKAGLNESYLDVGVADKIYYNVRELVRAIIDWQKLKEQLGDVELTKADEDLLVEMLYKTIMIADGQTNNQSFSYSVERVKKLTADPNNLREILVQLAGQLEQIKKIPNASDYSEVDEEGKRFYPRQVNIDGETCSRAFLLAKEKLQTGMANVLKNEEELSDLYEVVPAYPGGAMIGDFSQIKSLRDGQVDRAIGVRSTVYKQGGAYNEFMLSMIDKLSVDGIYIDDNVRDNFGVRYRIAELLEIQNQAGAEINLILGPGIKGEDDKKGEVPMAMIISKNKNHLSVVSELMQKDFRLVNLDQYFETLSQQKEKAQIIDPSGLLSEKLDKWKLAA